MLDRLYTPTLSAGMPPTAIWAFLRNGGANTATSITTSAVNVSQAPLLIQHFTASLTPGAAQYPTHWRLALRDPDNTLFIDVMGGQLTLTTAAVLTAVGGPTNDLVLPPRWALWGQAIFNAGANSNNVTITATGFYFPRGSLSLP